MKFIKLHVVYQANPTKKVQTENDLLMRESYYHICDIIEITPTIPDDDSIMAKTFVRFGFSSQPMSVMETAEEIVAVIEKEGCQV